MKRYPITLLLLLTFIYSLVHDAKTATSGQTSSKVAVPCPSTLYDISDCPDTGCGPSLDPYLNKQKNIRSVNQPPELITIQNIKNLPDLVPGYQIGDSREKLHALGEGKNIQVVAFALVARKGGGETCNCRLLATADTDNMIVLVNPTGHPTLAKDEEDSVTAEITPRVRLVHPSLTRDKLQPLITSAPGYALLVRVTGLLMFDSEHSLGRHLRRNNNWEIHPVLGLEYCPKGKTCTAGSDANWKDLEK